MKREVERIIGFNITDKQYKEAYGYAKKKQANIYKREHRTEVLKPCYLIKLIAECINQFAFAELTLILSKELYNIEKEHPHKQGTPQPSLL